MPVAILAVGGVYAITNTVNGKRYVGSSMDIKKRWRVHRSDLKNCKHHSIKLQRAYGKYGAHAFVFSVLEVVIDAGQLLAIEQVWLDCFGSAIGAGYNICPIAGNCFGVKASDGTKQKMRESWKIKREAKSDQHFQDIENRRKARVAEFDAANKVARSAYFKARRIEKSKVIAVKKASAYQQNKVEALAKSKAYYQANRLAKVEYARARRALNNGNKQTTTLCEDDSRRASL